MIENVRARMLRRLISGQYDLKERRMAYSVVKPKGTRAPTIVTVINEVIEISKVGLSGVTVLERKVFCFNKEDRWSLEESKDV